MHKKAFLNSFWVKTHVLILIVIQSWLYRLTVSFTGSFTIQTVHTLANNEIFRFSLWTSLVIAGCRIVMEVFADLKSNGGAMVTFKIVFCCISSCQNQVHLVLAVVMSLRQQTIFYLGLELVNSSNNWKVPLELITTF